VRGWGERLVPGCGERLVPGCGEHLVQGWGEGLKPVGHLDAPPGAAVRASGPRQPPRSVAMRCGRARITSLVMRIRQQERSLPGLCWVAATLASGSLGRRTAAKARHADEFSNFLAVLAAAVTSSTSRFCRGHGGLARAPIVDHNM
jgi:hypothetical protein